MKPFLFHHIDKVRTERSSRGSIAARKLMNEIRAEREQKRSKKEGLDKRVLIFTRRHDPEADLIALRLLCEGMDSLRINLEDIPKRSKLTCMIDRKAELRILASSRVGGNLNSFDLSGASVAWIRHFNPVELDLTGLNFRGAWKELYHSFSFQQWYDMVYSIQQNVRCKWINSPESSFRASNKLTQLSSAKQAGFEIPSTIVTNDPDEAKAFCKLHEGKVIIKALHSHAFERKGNMYSLHTHTFHSNDIAKIIEIKSAPVILQERIEKTSELRVTVVGNKVFAANIRFNNIEMAGDDIHRSAAKDLEISASGSFPADAAEKCRKIAKILGLDYLAIDFVLRQNKEDLVFLEVNPAGDWLWVEEATNLPISHAVFKLISTAD